MCVVEAERGGNGELAAHVGVGGEERKATGSERGEERGRRGVERPVGGVGDGGQSETDAREEAGHVAVEGGGVPDAAFAPAEVGTGRSRGEGGERRTGCRLRS